MKNSNLQENSPKENAQNLHQENQKSKEEYSSIKPYIIEDSLKEGVAKKINEMIEKITIEDLDLEIKEGDDISTIVLKEFVGEYGLEPLNLLKIVALGFHFEVPIGESSINLLETLSQEVKKEIYLEKLSQEVEKEINLEKLLEQRKKGEEGIEKLKNDLEEKLESFRKDLEERKEELKKYEENQNIKQEEEQLNIKPNNSVKQSNIEQLQQKSIQSQK